MKSLLVRLMGDDSGFRHMMDQASVHGKAAMGRLSHDISSSWFSAFKGGVVGGIASFLSFEAFRGLADKAKEIGDLSEQMDMSAQSLQRWQAAVEKAGLSWAGFQNIVGALAQKRNDARTDVKARESLNLLGFSDKEILDTEGMDNSAFTLKALNYGAQGKLQRAQLGQIVGPKGLKYISAAGEYPNSQALLGKSDLDNAKTLDKAEQAAGKSATTFLAKVVDFFRRSVHEWTWTPEQWLKDEVEQGKIDLNNPGSRVDLSKFKPEFVASLRAQAAQIKGHPADLNEAYRVWQKTGKVPDWATGKQDTSIPTNDPLAEIQRQLQQERTQQLSEAQIRLHAAQRGNMTIGDRRDSIRADLNTVLADVARREHDKAGGWLNADQKNNMSKSEQEAFIQKQELALLAAKAQAEEFKTQLIQKPNDFRADSLARVGLYGAGSVHFSPLLQIGQIARDVAEIRHNTARDVHSR